MSYQLATNSGRMASKPGIPQSCKPTQRGNFIWKMIRILVDDAKPVDIDIIFPKDVRYMPHHIQSRLSSVWHWKHLRTIRSFQSNRSKSSTKRWQQQVHMDFGATRYSKTKRNHVIMWLKTLGWLNILSNQAQNN